MSNNSEARPDWDHYFMEIAQVVSKRSTCLRRSVGAVIVKNKQILATGYNGTPKGMPHCGEVGCLREQLHVPSGKNHELCRGIHAEQNAVVQAAVHGVSVEGLKILTPTSWRRICWQVPGSGWKCWTRNKNRKRSVVCIF